MVSLDSWRRHFAIVTRDPLIFSMNLAENIALGRPEAAQAEIEAAAQMVQLHSFIAALPQGYLSQVGEGGVQLSAGQRQALALARVFLQDPAIVIFDEATTSLDRESEEVLIETLRLWAGQRTLLFVSHQPVAAWPVSRTVVLEDGRVADNYSRKEAFCRSQDGSPGFGGKCVIPTSSEEESLLQQHTKCEVKTFGSLWSE